MIPDSSETTVNVFLRKFDKILNFVLSLRGKTFSDEVSFLLEKALDHLKVIDTSNTNDDAHSALIETLINKQFFSETLNVATTPLAHVPILIFSIKALNELTNNDRRFHKFISASPDTFHQIHQIVMTAYVDKAEVKHALLEFFLCLSKFHKGREWIWSCGLLQFITQCLEDRAVFIRKTAQELIHNILMLSTTDQTKEMFERLLILMRKHVSELNNKQNQSDSMEIYLSVLSSYIETNMAENSTNSSGSELISLNIEDFLMNLAQSSVDKKLLGNVCSLMVGIYAKCASENASETTRWKDKTLELIKFVLNKELMQATLMVVSKSLFYWSNLKSNTEFQLGLVHIMVAIFFIETEEFREKCQSLIQYWKNCASNETSEISNKLDDMLKNDPSLNKMTTVVVAGLTKSMKNLGKDVSLKIMSSGLYLLECLTVSDCKRANQFYSLPQLAINLTEMLCSFMDFYRIYWWNCDQSLSFPVILNKLTTHYASRNIQVTCAGLQAMKFCLNQLIHADGDVIPDGPMDSIVSAIHHCSVSVNWEVRDSALEVILLMSQLSYSGYSGFQQLLVSSGLLQASVSAINDGEAYVRASALAVIASSTGTEILWQNINRETNVTQCCYMLLKDSEALARRAATKALTKIAFAGYLFDEDRNTLHRYMSYAALSDLDWEVKLEAINFWQSVVQECLSEQGLTEYWCSSEDESNFLQSKRRRLSETEKQSSIQHAISKLGACGCLHVLLQSIDDCDAPVREKSLHLLIRLRQLLTIGDIRVLPMEEIAEPQSSSSNASDPSHTLISSDVSSSNRAKVRNASESERVIEEILDADDVSLVKNILSDGKPILRENPDAVKLVDVEYFISKIRVLELDSMLKFTTISSDLHVSDLESLIDDLQDCIYTDHPKPRPDCY